MNNLGKSFEGNSGQPLSPESINWYIQQLILYVSVLALAMASVDTAQAEVDPDDISDAMRSFDRSEVRKLRKNSHIINTISSKCNAFALTARTLATARHCVLKDYDDSKTFQKVMMIDGKRVKRGIRQVYYFPEGEIDVAFITFSSPVFRSYTEITKLVPQDCTGGELIATTSRLEDRSIFFVGDIYVTSREGKPCYINLTAITGQSGSMVFDMDGNPIGIRSVTLMSDTSEEMYSTISGFQPLPEHSRNIVRALEGRPQLTDHLDELEDPEDDPEEEEEAIDLPEIEVVPEEEEEPKPRRKEQSQEEREAIEAANKRFEYCMTHRYPDLDFGDRSTKCSGYTEEDFLGDSNSNFEDCMTTEYQDLEFPERLEKCRDR